MDKNSIIQTAESAAKPAWSAGVLRIAIYLVVITGPVFLSATLKPQEKHEMHGFVEQFASTIALTAFPILAMQFVLSARIRWVEWPFGMDIVYLFRGNAR